MVPAILLVAAVAALAFILRAGAGRRDEAIAAAGPREDAMEGPPVPEPEEAIPWEDELEEEGLVEAAALTSDGWAFVPRGEGVELIPPGEDEDLLIDQARRHGSDALRQALSGAPVNPKTGRRLVFWKPGDSLTPRDLIAARVVRGAPSVDPWRLEALGRDYDYRAYAFETEDAARTALDLVRERVVRPPLDSDGHPIPVGDEEFAVARRKHEETEQALAMESDEERED